MGGNVKEKPAQPLRMQPDYGERRFPCDCQDEECDCGKASKESRLSAWLAERIVINRIASSVVSTLLRAVNQYLNTPPTELRRMIDKEKNPGKKKEMQEALAAWRYVVPGPFRKPDVS